ncbi:putative non-specific serine/threonine protein kinase [Helianthus debilis subsp. tardiflorus]
MVEVVQTVERPHARFSKTEIQEKIVESPLAEKPSLVTPGRETPVFDPKGRTSTHERQPSIEPEELMTKDVARTYSWDRAQRVKDMRQGIDLATTLEASKRLLLYQILGSLIIPLVDISL